MKARLVRLAIESWALAAICWGAVLIRWGWPT